MWNEIGRSLIVSGLDLDALRTASALLLGLACGLLVSFVAQVPSLPLVEGGTRGLRRARALRSPLFSFVDPILRKGGGILRDLVGRLRRSGGRSRELVDKWEGATSRQLVWAGEPGGLDRHELLFISLALSVLAASVALFVITSLVWVLPSALVGALLPYFRLQAIAQARFVEAAHELPPAIDLMALAMSAGVDLPGALRRVALGRNGVVAEELGYVLHSLDLGITRSSALLGLRERLPIEEVRDLVRAVRMAEKKGTSIAEALNHQARAGRERRSVRAEESAARAGVLLIVPLMLLMGSILIMMVGPLLSSEMGF
jgi:tight adherence protein C